MQLIASRMDLVPLQTRMTQKSPAQDILFEYMKGGEYCKEISVYAVIILKRISKKLFLFTLNFLKRQ